MNASFDVTAFQKKLSTRWLGQDFHYFASMPSTNTYAKKLDAEQVDEGGVIFTDHQTGGRGQYDRTWESNSGQNLTFSMIFRPRTTDGFHVLTMACALAVVEQMNDYSEHPCARIKWPNDVLLNDKKVAGLLTEAVFLGNKLEHLVIGIGLNVNQQSFHSDIADKATSIRLETEKRIPREALLSRLLARIEQKYQLWNRKQSDLLVQINRAINGYGRWVDLKIDGQLTDDPYKLLGVNEFGRLVVLNQEGGLESFSYEQIRVVTD